ncbi:type II toxin-antitoxin system PemK/MazF family toxin [Spirosoma sp. HMF4905]|uniref:Type II toxin-antitoxin system PemK/MazF family toxin n=1 Tax=Spirosoma arboris TaxID=2682092 RepID=A0A7K1SJW9_9BACT|nr:type II toxin-antitoxin system PemK/MazF family toxin [Spirosoma arboris]
MKPGSIILIKLQQADGGPKQRPAIVLKQMPGYGDFLVCGISSRLQQTIPEFDEVLRSNSINGLKVTSVIRLGFLDVIPAKHIVEVIGRVPDVLYNSLLQRLADYLKQIET